MDPTNVDESAGRRRQMPLVRTRSPGVRYGEGSMRSVTCTQRTGRSRSASPARTRARGANSATRSLSIMAPSSPAGSVPRGPRQFGGFLQAAGDCSDEAPIAGVGRRRYPGVPARACASRTRRRGPVSDVTSSPTLDADEARVEELGYHSQLKREFGFFHAFAISFADTSLIVAFYGVFALSLAAAGPTFFWGLLVVLAGQLLVALVLAEVASRWPLEGGVCQWTRQQTGARAGWFAAWGYWWTMVFTVTTCAYAAASFILPGVGVANAPKGAFIALAIVMVIFGTAINSIAQPILKVFVSLLLVAEATATIGLA